NPVIALQPPLIILVNPLIKLRAIPIIFPMNHKLTKLNKNCTAPLMIFLIDSHKAVQLPVNKAENASITPVITDSAPSITPLMFSHTCTTNNSTSGQTACMIVMITSIAICMVPETKFQTFCAASLIISPLSDHHSTNPPQISWINSTINPMVVSNTSCIPCQINPITSLNSSLVVHKWISPATNSPIAPTTNPTGLNKAVKTGINAPTAPTNGATIFNSGPIEIAPIVPNNAIFFATSCIAGDRLFHQPIIVLAPSTTTSTNSRIFSPV